MCVSPLCDELELYDSRYLFFLREVPAIDFIHLLSLVSFPGTSIFSCSFLHIINLCNSYVAMVLSCQDFVGLSHEKLSCINHEELQLAGHDLFSFCFSAVFILGLCGRAACHSLRRIKRYTREGSR